MVELMQACCGHVASSSTPERRQKCPTDTNSGEKSSHEEGNDHDVAGGLEQTRSILFPSLSPNSFNEDDDNDRKHDQERAKSKSSATDSGKKIGESFERGSDSGGGLIMKDTLECRYRQGGDGECERSGDRTRDRHAYGKEPPQERGVNHDGGEQVSSGDGFRHNVISASLMDAKSEECGDTQMKTLYNSVNNAEYAMSASEEEEEGEDENEEGGRGDNLRNGGREEQEKEQQPRRWSHKGVRDGLASLSELHVLGAEDTGLLCNAAAASNKDHHDQSVKSSMGMTNDFHRGMRPARAMQETGNVPRYSAATGIDRPGTVAVDGRENDRRRRCRSGSGCNGGAGGERGEGHQDKGAYVRNPAKVDVEWENEIAKNILSLYQTKLKAELYQRRGPREGELGVRRYTPYVYVYNTCCR